MDASVSQAQSENTTKMIKSNTGLITLPREYNCLPSRRIHTGTFQCISRLFPRIARLITKWMHLSFRRRLKIKPSRSNRVQDLLPRHANRNANPRKESLQKPFNVSRALLHKGTCLCRFRVTQTDLHYELAYPLAAWPQTPIIQTSVHTYVVESSPQGNCRFGVARTDIHYGLAYPLAAWPQTPIVQTSAYVV